MEKLIRYKGRPKDVSGRQEKEIRVYDFLDELGIDYYRLDHEPADSDHPEVCEAVDEALGAKICKNLFLANRQRTKFYMLMIPADKVFRSSDILAPEKYLVSMIIPAGAREKVVPFSQYNGIAEVMMTDGPEWIPGGDYTGDYSAYVESASAEYESAAAVRAEKRKESGTEAHP